MDEDLRADLIAIGIDPDAPAKPCEYLCGACERGAHADCSGWCYCPKDCKNAGNVNDG